MFSCFSIDQNLPFDKQVEEYGNRFINFMNQLGKITSQKIDNFIDNLAEFSEFPSDFIGMVDEVKPLSDNIPPEYKDKCYHAVRMSDDQNCYEFKLIFKDRDFSELSPHLQPGYMLRITYDRENLQIFNLYPQPYWEEMTYEEFLDSVNISNLHPVRAHYFEGDVTKVEFLYENEDEDDMNEDDNKDDNKDKNE